MSALGPPRVTWMEPLCCLFVQQHRGRYARRDGRISLMSLRDVTASANILPARVLKVLSGAMKRAGAFGVIAPAGFQSFKVLPLRVLGPGAGVKSGGGGGQQSEE